MFKRQQAPPHPDMSSVWMISKPGPEVEVVSGGMNEDLAFGQCRASREKSSCGAQSGRYENGLVPSAGLGFGHS